MDQLGLVEAVDRLGERIVVAVPTTTDRWLDASLRQPLAVSNRYILRSPGAVMNQTAALLRAAVMQGLFKGVEHEVRVHAGAHAPADDAPGKDIDHEGHVQPALPGRDIGEVRNLQLVRSLGPEATVHPVQWAGRRQIRRGGAYRLSATHALYAESAH